MARPYPKRRSHAAEQHAITRGRICSVAFRESLVRILELVIGVAAGIFLAGQFAEPVPQLSSLVVALFVVGIMVVGAIVAAWIRQNLARGR